MTSKSSEDLKTDGKGRKRTMTTVNSSVCYIVNGLNPGVSVVRVV